MNDWVLDAKNVSWLQGGMKAEKEAGFEMQDTLCRALGGGVLGPYSAPSDSQ